MLSEVYINRTASFLPFDPVNNDEIEAVLGMVGGRPSRARRVILRSNGIQSRHYAIDRATGRVVMTNAQLTAQAVRALGPVGSVELLACGTSSPDQLLPNHAAMDIKPGSMGRPLPGIEAAIVQRLPDGHIEPVEQPDTMGELALRPGWPSMFRGYLDDEAR